MTAVLERPTALLTQKTSRDPVRLIEAVSDLLVFLGGDRGDGRDALRASFKAVAEGLGAQNAVLLLVERTEPLSLRCIHSLGGLTREQLAACEQGQSVRGVSPSVIRRVVETGRPERIRDPLELEEGCRTVSLDNTRFSVLCAPVLDPADGAVLAVIYLQNQGLAAAYRDPDLACLGSYGVAAGRLLGYHFRSERQARVLKQRLALKEEIENAPEILGESTHTQALRFGLHEVFIPTLEAVHPEPVLILGERGTGKDLIARYLHAYSARRRRPMVVVNCAEIGEELAASRLFGHKKGSFTGALSDEPGCFRAADGGVLFLDEVAELSPRIQAQLLRVLESHTVIPVGTTREISVDVAVVLATNRDLDEAVREGALRADFHDRFRTFAIHLQPLRNRPWDIPQLLDHFRLREERKYGKPTLGFTQEAFRALVAYDWPGNVRELARACTAFVMYARLGVRLDYDLVLRCVPAIAISAPNPKASAVLGDGLSYDDAIREYERELILSRLRQYGGCVRRARESLKLTKSTFHRMMHSLGIPTGQERE
ncbi:MAG TPA: sigma 54-interacting transcriptional regulator [Thermoanaerobaculia bacterium]|jgi:transcriptional regulator with GAF, ATPase, and Fis domain|nr:sigma 54-interacting transcriptional regulator [Thermoanaerobaculia bacterium]